MARDQHPLTPLEEALEAWEDIRDGVIAEVDNIPEDRFAFRPAPDTRTVAELVRHVMEVALLMTGELCRADTNLRREPWPQLLAAYDGPIRKASSKTDLIAALSSTFKESVRRFRELGEDGVLQPITRFDGKKGTKLAWLHHGLAHEEYHRGQLAVYQRLMGIEPALTRLIRGG
jgi:uncharacterized damage-inducible protein DinB